MRPRDALRRTTFGRAGALLVVCVVALSVLAAPAEAASRLVPPLPIDIIEPPGRTLGITLTPSPFALVPGGYAKVRVLEPSGDPVIATRANVTIALFFAYRLAEWDPKLAAPAYNLHTAEWLVQLYNVNLQGSQGAATFVYPGVPGATRTPSVLWAQYEDVQTGDTYQGYYSYTARAAGDRGALVNAVAARVPTVVFAN